MCILIRIKPVEKENCFKIKIYYIDCYISLLIKVQVTSQVTGLIAKHDENG